MFYKIKNSKISFTLFINFLDESFSNIKQHINIIQDLPVSFAFKEYISNLKIIVDKLKEAEIDDPEKLFEMNKLFSDDTFNDIIVEMFCLSVINNVESLYKTIFKIEVHIYCLEKNFYQLKQNIINSKDFKNNDRNDILLSLMNIITQHGERKVAAEILKQFFYTFNPS
jgi:hypothetical protein